MKETKPYVFSF